MNGFRLGDQDQILLAVLKAGDGERCDGVSFEEGLALQAEGVHGVQIEWANQISCIINNGVMRNSQFSSEQIPLPSPQEILSMITEFYCSLTDKKDIHQIVAPIRQFVMHRPIVHKDYAAKLLVDYFLRLQVKLKAKTQQEWDTMFQLSTARDRACISLSQFPYRHACRETMNKLKECQFLNPSDELTETQNTEFDDICIDEDIKLKTDCFFSWCLFVRQAKAFRQLKQQDIENLKISKTFNNFGIKFNCFVGWKQLCKKKRALKEKADLLKTKANDRLTLACVHKIQEVTSIISIEQKLTQKVIERLIFCRKKESFKRLGDNKLKNRLLTRKLPKNRNLMFYQFLRELIGTKKPNLSRSFVFKRAECAKEEQQLLTKKSFKILQTLMIQKRRLINQVEWFRKKEYLKAWKSKIVLKNQVSLKSQFLNAYLTQKKKKIAFIVFSFSHLAHQELCKRLQDMLNVNTSQDTLAHVSWKKEMRKREMMCFENLKLSRKLRSMKKFLQVKDYKITNNERFRRINLLIKQRFFTHFRILKINLKNTQQYFNFLAEQNNTKIIKKSFKKWKLLKKYNKREVEALKSINQLHILSTKIQFWMRLTRQAHQKQCVQEISQKIMNIINRVTFVKLAGRTVRINKQVQKFKLIKQKKAMKNLFNLLIANSKHKEKMCQKVVLYHAEVCKKILIDRLKERVLLKQRQEKAALISQKAKKMSFTRELIETSQAIMEMTKKYELISKKLFINYMFRSIQRTANRAMKLEQKQKQLINTLKTNSQAKLIRNMKKVIQYQEKQQQKTYQLVKKIARRGIKLVNTRIVKQKAENKMIEKTISVQKMRKSNVLTDLMFEYREKKILTQYVHSRHLEGIQILRKTMNADMKLQKCIKQVCDFVEERQMLKFYRLMRNNRDEMKENYSKLSNLMSTKVEKDKKSFFEQAKDYKTHRKQVEQLVQKKKHTHLSELMTTAFRGKFFRVKFNCSLKFYAKNLLKKGFKTMKKQHMRIKHKENIMRMDKTSSIVMEKSIDKSFKSNSLSEQVQKFNLRRSKQLMMRAL